MRKSWGECHHLEWILSILKNRRYKIVDIFKLKETQFQFSALCLCLQRWMELLLVYLFHPYPIHILHIMCPTPQHQLIAAITHIQASKIFRFWVDATETDWSEIPSSRIGRKEVDKMQYSNLNCTTEEDKKKILGIAQGEEVATIKTYFNWNGATKDFI